MWIMWPMWEQVRCSNELCGHLSHEGQVCEQMKCPQLSHVSHVCHVGAGGVPSNEPCEPYRPCEGERSDFTPQLVRGRTCTSKTRGLIAN